MKLLIFNIPNTLNYGSMMMAENLFHYLSDFNQNSNTEFIVVTPKPEETLSRFKRALGERSDIIISTIHPLKLIQGNRAGRITSYVTGIGFKKKLVSEIFDVDGVVVLGGDDFTEDYGYMGPILSLLKFKRFIKIGKKVILCGQTVGPFLSWRRRVARSLLKNITKIIARDPITYRYLTEEFKLSNVLLGADLAFLPLAGEKDSGANCHINPVNVGLKEKYCTIVPSELLWKYAKEPVREVYIDMLTNIALDLFEKSQGGQLLILPHVLAPGSSDDRLAGRDLYINLKRRGIESSKIVFPKEELIPCQAREFLARSQIVITGRMHAAISSFARGVPAISFSYSRKYWGIIGEYFGLEELIVDVRDKPWEEIGNICKQQIEAVLDKKEQIKKKIALKTAEMRKMAMNGIQETFNILNLKKFL